MFSLKKNNEFNELVEQLENDLPFKNFSSSKLSKLRVLKATCTYLSKLRSFEYLNESNSLNYLIDFEQQYGFIVCFSAKGKLIYLSENVADHLGFKNTDILFTHDSIFELVCDQDINKYISLTEITNLENSNSKITFYSHWWVSKIRRKNTANSEFRLLKMIGGFDVKTNLFIFNCQPVLSKLNREFIMENDSNCFKLFLKLDLEIYDMCFIASSLLEYEIEDLNCKKTTLYDIASQESLSKIAEKHKELIRSKSTKTFLNHIKLFTKTGLVLDCLMNIHVNNKGYIVGNFQLITESELREYDSYFKKIESVKLTKTHDKSDCINDEIESEYFDFNDIKMNTEKFAKKRKSNSTEKDDRINCKILKTTELKNSSQKLQRESSAQIKIQTIKHKLIGEIQNLDHGCRTSIDQETLSWQYPNIQVKEEELQQNHDCQTVDFEKLQDEIFYQSFSENQSLDIRQNTYCKEEKSFQIHELSSSTREEIDSSFAMENLLVNFQSYYDQVLQDSDEIDSDEIESFKFSNQNNLVSDYFNSFLCQNFTFNGLSDIQI